MKTDNELDRDIEALLGVEPPPEFLARVRARIAHTPEPGTWRFRWLFAGAAALAAAVVAVHLISPAHEPARVEVAAEAPIIPERVAERPPVVVAPAVRPVNIRKTEPRQPELLIAASETAALRRILNGPLVQLPAGFLEPAAEIEIQPLADPTPITIEPIKITDADD